MLRSVIIGIDGGTWDVLGPLMERGHMPNLAKLTQKGASCPLRSVLPAITSTAWPTFMIGKGPGHHGCFDWGSLDADYKMRFVSFDRVTSLAFWDVLNMQGERVGVVNMPFTYPPRKLDSFMTAGLGVPSLEHTWTYPLWLGERLLSEFGDYPLDRTYTGDRAYALDHIVAELMDRDRRITDILLWLLDEFAVEHAVVVYTGSDRLQHIAMRRFTDMLPDESLPEWGVQYYQAIDQQVGRLLNRADASTNIMIVSDHGFTTLDKHFFVNDWLRQNQWLATHSSFQQLAHRFGSKLTRWAKLDRRGSGATGHFDTTSMLGEVINWRRTRAFSNSHNGIYINSKGRFTHGIVEPGHEYHRVRQDLRAALTKVVDPETGRRILERVYNREDIYSGPYVEEAPDLILEFVKDAYVTSRYFLSTYRRARKLHEPPFAAPRSSEIGQHHRDGILVLKGPAFRQGAKLLGAHLMDMAPTWLHACGAPIPSDMEGRLLIDAFLPDFMSQNPPQNWDVEQATVAGRSRLSDEESRLLHQRLKDLGYLE